MTESTLSLLLSIISLIVAIAGVFMSIKISYVGIHNQNRYIHQNITIELFKKIVEDPALLNIFDDNYKGSDPAALGKREAGMYYVLNLYEIIYEHYKIRKSVFYKPPEREWNVWDRAITNRINGSSYFRNLIRQPEVYSEFSEEFISYLTEKIEDYDRSIL